MRDTIAAEKHPQPRPDVRSRTLRGGLFAVASIVLIGLVAPNTAGAVIKIYQSSEAATFLGKVKKAKCKVTRRGKVFHAGGKTTNGVYEFGVDIYDFNGFRADYNVPFGVINPTVNVAGIANGEDYSNNYPFPGGQPPPSAGTIRFGRRGAKLGVGVYSLPNSDYSQGVVLAGALDCIYPRR